MSTNKMTPTPWMCDVEGNHSIHISSTKGGATYAIATCYCDPLDETTKADAAAIVSAVNNTFGCGINPGAVSALLKALEHAHESLVHYREMVSKGASKSVIANCQLIMLKSENIAKAAIVKATIKP